MVQTRGKRAAASPPPAPEPEVKKQAKAKRGKKGAAVEPINEADDKDGINEAVDTQVVADSSLANVNDGIDEAVDAQVAPNASLAIPVDDHCPLSNYRVYIDPESKVIFDASLNQV